MNKAILIGRVGQDPESKDVNGSTVVNLSVATDESYKDKSGQKVEQTEWHKVNAWGRLAEIIVQYVKKGDLICIEGKIQTRKYEKDGVTHYMTEIRANEMKMLGSRPAQESTPKPRVSSPEPEESSDLPF